MTLAGQFKELSRGCAFLIKDYRCFFRLREKPECYGRFGGDEVSAVTKVRWVRHGRGRMERF